MTARSAHLFLRRAWLAALPLWAGACVAPVAPQFEDPTGNYSPYLVSSDPPAGSVLSTGTPIVAATLADPNLQDDLYGRWLIDYPPYDDSRSRLALEFRLPPSDAVDRETVRFAPNCAEDQIAASLDSHRVTLSVADRPFVPPEQAPADLRLDTVPDDGFLLRATWILNLTCP